MAARNDDYYDYGKVLSYNGIFNFIPGGRGIGKTYGAKRRSIKNFFTKGSQFIYARRYKDALSTSAKTFFADVAWEFPDYDFRIHGNEAQCASVASRDEKKREWSTMGYFFAMSVAQQIKSTAFPLVDTIIYDEFIEETAVPGYLKDEYTIFLNFYNTVARRRPNVIVLFLANAVSMMNPYFIALGIEPDKLPELSKSHKGFVVCHFPDSSKYNNAVYQTRFGQFIQGTEYAAYAVENQFEDANDNLVDGKPSRAKPQFNLQTQTGEFSVWYDRQETTYYIYNKPIKDHPVRLTLDPLKMDKERLRVTHNHPLMADLRRHYDRALMRFESPAARNAFAQVFKK